MYVFFILMREYHNFYDGSLSCFLITIFSSICIDLLNEYHRNIADSKLILLRQEYFYDQRLEVRNVIILIFIMFIIMLQQH